MNIKEERESNIEEEIEKLKKQMKTVYTMMCSYDEGHNFETRIEDMTCEVADISHTYN